MCFVICGPKEAALKKCKRPWLCKSHALACDCPKFVMRCVQNHICVKQKRFDLPPKTLYPPNTSAFQDTPDPWRTPWNSKAPLIRPCAGRACACSKPCKNEACSNNPEGTLVARSISSPYTPTPCASAPVGSSYDCAAVKTHDYTAAKATHVKSAPSCQGPAPCILRPEDERRCIR